MKNYVINLAHSTDRRANVESQLKKIGMTPNFFPAVYGKALSSDDLKRLVFTQDALSIGEIGCALSHLNVFQDMINNDVPYAIVFEDDILVSTQLSVELLAKLDDFVSRYSPNKAVVVSLYNSRNKGKLEKQITDQVSLIQTVTENCTHAYIINQFAAKNILQIQRPLKFEIDMWRYYVYLGAIDFFTTNTTLIMQQGFESEIWQLTSREHSFFKKRNKIKKMNFSLCMKTKPLNIKIRSIYLSILKLLKLR